MSNNQGNGYASNISSDVNKTEVLMVFTWFSSNKWVLDSCCSYHMCRDLNAFVFYNDSDSCQVLLGNDVSYKVTDGSVNVFQKLDVLLV